MNSSPYFLRYNFYKVSLENLVLDHLVISLLIFSLFLTPVRLINFLRRILLDSDRDLNAVQFFR